MPGLASASITKVSIVSLQINDGHRLTTIKSEAHSDSILPKPLEPLRTELGVAHGVRNVAMTQVLLN
jgi:hypothetical protein